MENTTRDRVWNAALKRTIRNGNVVTVSETAERVGCSERTARDVLNLMVEWGFLEAEHTKHQKEYTAAPDPFSDLDDHL